MGALEAYYQPSESIPIEKNVDESSPNSLPLPPPPTQTLDGFSNSRDDYSHAAWLFDTTAQEDEDHAGEFSHSSPVRPDFSSSWSKWSQDDEPQPLAVVDTNPPDSETRLSFGQTDCKPLLIISPSSLWYDDEKPSMVGAGLSNLGNTCFLNAILQCFTHTAPLVQALYSYTHAIPCDCSSEQFCLFCALREHIKLSLASTGKVVSPLKFVDHLSYFSSSFRRFEQEDAHEFLQCFLDRLERCNNLMTKDTTFSIQNHNLVKQIFGGRLVSKLRCCNCNHCSDTYEPSIDLSLEIEDADNLFTALESFTKVEKIEDAETKFTCEKCKEEVLVEKQLMLDQAPQVYAFHLKRFKNDGSYVEKIDKHVDFPLELDLQPYTSDSQSDNVDLKYELYGVVVHAAYTTSFGHYYCFIRSAPDTWYKFDDSKVIKVSEAYVLSEEAYILFYAKQGIPWVSSFMETIKSSLHPNISNSSPKSVLENVEPNATSPDVTNNHCCDVNETSEAADGISTESFNRSRRGRLEVSECKDNVEKVSSPSALKEYSFHRKLDEGQNNASITPKTSCNVEKVFSPSALKDYNFNHKFDEVQNNASISPTTPPRSPILDICEEDPPEMVFSTNRHQLKIAEKASHKRPWNNDAEDFETKEAYKQCKKMPGSRGAILMAALNQKGSKSEGSLNKTRKRMASPRKDYSHSSDRCKPIRF